MGKRIENYDIPRLEQSMDDGIILECGEIMEEKSIMVPSEDLNAQTKLNPEQEQAFKIILQTLESGKSGLFFVDGPGRAKKIFLYRVLLANIRYRGMIALEMATSSIASALLSGGHMAHSRFKILLQTIDTTVTRMSK
ncbi:hypothetical protein P3L10_032964 [Capsicum annuum]